MMLSTVYGQEQDTTSALFTTKSKALEPALVSEIFEEDDDRELIMLLVGLFS